MDFVNKGLSSFWIIILSFIGIFFLINILPVIILITAGVWGVSYVIKATRKWHINRKNFFKGEAEKSEKVETIKQDFSEGFTTGKVIDVEYTEIK
ncbi:hypothetical protein M2651_13440 [Clostridium sp. SYSU_GA19001]|uniref:hypothetical protein n=1 Tax=Clostridium caldaquaticum TaxID=2940653 RepID=UPI002076E6C2|nr:hypothetical protein [Clostridium caldaquaticum]MCM8711998.1 hypothetical protein [Clostridium caldaquaticum]